MWNAEQNLLSVATADGFAPQKAGECTDGLED